MKKIAIYIFIIIFIFFLLLFFCRKEQSESSLINLNIWEKSPVHSLPLGPEELVNYFRKIDFDYGSDSLGNTIKETLNVLAKCDSFYKDQVINDSMWNNNYPCITHFFKADSFYYSTNSPLIIIDKYKDFYLRYKLPDIFDIKVFYVVANDIRYPDFLGYYSFLVATDSNYQPLDYLRLYSYSSTWRGAGADQYVFIDTNYMIHVKNIVSMHEPPNEYNDEMCYINVLASEMYKISPSGKFVRYFTENNVLNYNGVWEKGTVKNHVKEGLWTERIGGDWGMYVISDYKKGVLTKEQIFYSNKEDLKKGNWCYKRNVEKNIYTPGVPVKYQKNVIF